MERPERPGGTVTLDNCADEAIHLPGSIQPHGVLLALHDDHLAGWSDNAGQWLGMQVVAGAHWSDLGLPAAVAATLGELIADASEQAGVAASAPVDLADATFDLVVHRHGDRTIVEFEHRAVGDDQVAGFALMAHRAMERLKKAPDLNALLQRLAREVRALTGFDRVMTYRFRHDHSGDVVGEDHAEGLAPYLGMRYPASDIPEQARRLYTLNTLRLIADIGYTPVPLRGGPGQPPLDLTHAVLRSVSPIHVEYLQNMGVAASMSVSIVVQGRLWGLVACHHMSPRQVPYSVRMACDVLAQVVASSVQTLQARDDAERQRRLTRLHDAVSVELAQTEDTLDALVRLGGELASSFEADAVVSARGERVRVSGDIPEALAQAMVRTLAEGDDGLRALDKVDDWPEAIRPHLDGWVGALLLSPDPFARHRVLLLRREQVSTIRWAGPPDDKRVVVGPLGPRLTPRGSFAEWRETVHGRSVPWSDAHLQAARDLGHGLQRTFLSRHAEIETARQNLLAMLGHDLRDPLQAIRMVAGRLSQNEQAPRLASRLESSSRRMQRLVSQVLDFSRAEAGLPLVQQTRPVRLAEIVDDLVEESRMGHPGVVIHWQGQGPAHDLLVHGDEGRLSQLVGNLLSNARHHGQPGAPVRLDLSVRGAKLHLVVGNMAPPIDPALAASLFEPLRRGQGAAQRNRDGLGLGLFIASRIAQEHGAELHYRHEAPWVTFECVFTLPPEGANGAGIP